MRLTRLSETDPRRRRTFSIAKKSHRHYGARNQAPLRDWLIFD